MKKYLLMLCVLALMGCNDRSLEDLKAEVEAREAAAAEKAAIAAAKAKSTYSFKGPQGYSYELIKVCVDGIQYYYGDNGHSGMLAPVVRKDTLHFTYCDKPEETQ